jgi:hypothetical protein
MPFCRTVTRSRRTEAPAPKRGAFCEPLRPLAPSARMGLCTHSCRCWQLLAECRTQGGRGRHCRPRNRFGRSSQAPSPLAESLSPSGSRRDPYCSRSPGVRPPVAVLHGKQDLRACPELRRAASSLRHGRQCRHVEAGALPRHPIWRGSDFGADQRELLRAILEWGQIAPFAMAGSQGSISPPVFISRAGAPRAVAHLAVAFPLKFAGVENG